MIRPHNSYGAKTNDTIAQLEKNFSGAPMNLSASQPADPSMRQLPAAAKKRRGSKSSSKKNGPDVLLPKDFEPSEYTVIIGRGKKIRETTGNRRLRVIAASFLPQYAEAADSEDRAAKTRLVNTVVDLVEGACKESDSNKNLDSDRAYRQCRAFVRQTKDDGRWYEVDDSVAREKVGYAFRDLLADRYESSSKSKVAKKLKLQRQREREQQQWEQQRRQEEREERIMVDALLDLTTGTHLTPTTTTQPNAVSSSERNSENDDIPMTPITSSRDALEDDLLNSPIIECLPME